MFSKRNRIINKIGMTIIAVSLFSVFVFALNLLPTYNHGHSGSAQIEIAGINTVYAQEIAEADHLPGRTLGDKLIGIGNSIANLGKTVANAILVTIARFLFWVASWLLWAAGSLLNISIFVGIEKMGAIVKESGVIKDAWGIFRDFINMFFIFGLLYISIKTIIDGWSQNTRESLGKIIAAALLINFSFFFTAVLIDASNLLILQIYRQMSSECLVNIDTIGGGSDVDWFQKAFYDKGLSNCFMQATGVATTLSPNAPDGDKTIFKEETISGGSETSDASKTFTGILMQAIFILIVAVVLFAAAFMIIARFLALIFLIVLSPVFFLSWIIPQAGDASKKWVSNLTSNLIAVPVMFVFLYITIQMSSSNFLEIAHPNLKGGTFSGLVNSGGASLGILLNYVIIVGFAIGSIKLAKHLGAAGAEFAGKFGGAMALGGIGLGLRKTLGAGGRLLSQNQTMQRWARSGGMGGGIAKGLVLGGDRAARGSFDVRSTKSFSTMMGAAGVDVGSAQGKGGVAQIAKDKGIAMEKRDKLLGRETLGAEEAERLKQHTERTVDTSKFDADLARNSSQIQARKKQLENAEKMGLHGSANEIKKSIGVLEAKNKDLEKQKKDIQKKAAEKILRKSGKANKHNAKRLVDDAYTSSEDKQRKKDMAEMAKEYDKLQKAGGAGPKPEPESKKP